MTEDPTSPSNPKPSSQSTSSSWKLPEGIEDHIETALIKGAIGAAAGGVLGMVLFRSGKGRRTASVAAGVGVAVGSTFERYMYQNSA